MAAHPTEPGTAFLLSELADFAVYTPLAERRWLTAVVASNIVGTIVDSEGVAIRTGHHCAQPVMEHFGIAATARASLGMYNTKDDIELIGVEAGGRAGGGED